MQLHLSQSEFRELLHLTFIGTHVRNTAYDTAGMYDPETDDALFTYLCDVGLEYGIEAVEEDFDGNALLTPLHMLMCLSLLEAYDLHDVTQL